MKESIEEFVYLSKLFGALDELVQAGGGNISVKNASSNSLIIKASGYCLADVTEKDGYVIIDLEKATIKTNENKEYDTSDVIKTKQTSRASIETYFHVFLKKYVVHLHPTIVNKYMCNNKIPEITGSLTIDYVKPGYQLSEEIRSKYTNESIVFLKSHGVICTHDTFQGVIDTVAAVIDKLNNNNNLSRYIEIKRKMNNPYNLLMPTNKIITNNEILAFTPDVVVYLGRVIANANNTIKDSDILIRDGQNLFIQADKKYKCYQIYEVLLSYLELMKTCTITLSDEEADKIQKWPAEIYRKTV